MSLRCSYYSNYQYRKLNIYCFEYNTKFERDVVYFNGRSKEYETSPLFDRNQEFETSPLFERSQKDINIRTINIKDYSQTLHMSIK